MHVILSVSALALLAILAVLVDIAMHLRLACDRIGTAQALPLRAQDSHHGGPDGLLGSDGTPAVAYAIWAFEDDGWLLLQPCGRAGCDCGPPPDGPGGYEGEVVRKECPRPRGR
jgi:hypothetical protein